MRKKWELVLDDRTIVRGAGGILYRFRSELKKHPEILLIHRPRLQDWSFPKGRLDPGETSPACALREVLEETGYTCELSTELPTVRYMDSSGRPKEVRFWRMIPTSGATFVPNQEVDKIAWMDARDAFSKLTHKTDRLLLKHFLRLKVNGAERISQNHSSLDEVGPDEIVPAGPAGSTMNPQQGEHLQRTQGSSE